MSAVAPIYSPMRQFIIGEYTRVASRARRKRNFDIVKQIGEISEKFRVNF